MTPTQADLVREMCAQMRAYLDGHIGGTSLGQWARQRLGEVPGFRGHAVASSVLDSLLDLEDNGRSPRRCDVEAYLRWLTEGVPSPLQDEPLVVLPLTPDEIASRLSLCTVRWCLDGLGWVTEVRFVAPGTGRPFAAGCLDLSPPLHGSPSSSITTDHPRSLRALLDLFDTLCIDLSDIPMLDGKPGWNEAISVEGLPRWCLMRQDDNGRRFEMETFTAPRKARERLQAYEALHHKQIYWLEALETERLPAPSEARRALAKTPRWCSAIEGEIDLVSGDVPAETSTCRATKTLSP